MARTQAIDFNEKRIAIRKQAAQLFAEDGYDRTAMSTLASQCGVSKALLYHYYSDKEALLYDVIHGHLEELCETVEKADLPGVGPEDRLLNLIEGLLEAYAHADNEHRVQINALKFLPDDKQEVLKDMERKLVVLFSDALADCLPELKQDKKLLKPVTMSLFGMLNWHYMWFRPGGALSREDYAKLARRIILDGANGILKS